MRKIAILAFAGRKPRNKHKNSLIVENVIIGNVNHLIIDLYEKKNLIYRMAITDKEFAHYDYKNEKWDAKTGYNNPYRNSINNAEITDNDFKKLLKYRNGIVESQYRYRECVEEIIFNIEAHITLLHEKKKREKESIERDVLFQKLPDLPELLHTTIRRKVDEKNIIYYKRKGSRADYFCCQCGEEFSRKLGYEEADMQFMCHAYIPVPKRLGFDHCDRCGKSARLLQRGYAKLTIQEFETILYQTADDGTLIARGFYTCAQRNEYGPIDVRTREYGRMFMRKGVVRSYHQYCGNDSWYKNKHLVINPKTEIYSIDYENAVAGSDLKYIPKDMYELTLSSNVATSETEIEVSKFYALMSYANAPQLETLYKIGFSGICRRIMWQQGSTRQIDKRAKTAADILRITRQELKYLTDYSAKKSDIRILDMIYFAKRHNITINQFDKLEPLYGSYEENNIEYLLRFQSMEKLWNYLNKQIVHYQSFSSLLREYSDYLREREAQGDDLSNPIYLRPRDLNETYTRVRIETEQKKDKKYIEKMEEQYPDIKKRASKIPKKYIWQQSGLIIRPAMSAEEIVLEGRILHHCVGSDRQRYMDNYNKGKAWIFVIRHTDEADIPFVTVEIKDNEIIQWYGEHDTKPDKEHVESFLNEYLKHIKRKERIA